MPIPKSVFAHGFVYSKGTKMSKTIGNILDPVEVAEFFGGADPLRYLLLREIAFDRDGDFTIEQAVTRYNAELANELGNLFSRTLSMVNRYRDGAVPEWSDAASTDYERLAGNVVDEYCSHMDALEFDEALNAFWKTVQAANRYVEQQKPWQLAKTEDPIGAGHHFAGAPRGLQAELGAVHSVYARRDRLECASSSGSKPILRSSRLTKPATRAIPAGRPPAPRRRFSRRSKPRPNN